jgi:hypothetical protein
VRLWHKRGPETQAETGSRWPDVEKETSQEEDATASGVSSLQKAGAKAPTNTAPRLLTWLTSALVQSGMPPFANFA